MIFGAQVNKFYIRQVGEALHPEYESLKTLNKLRREMGSELFQAESACARP